LGEFRSNSPHPVKPGAVERERSRYEGAQALLVSFENVGGENAQPGV